MEFRAPQIDNSEVLRRMRIHWLSNVAHDLRGPLFAARGYANLLLEERAGTVTVTQKNYLKSVVENINKLSSIVGMLHDFPADEALDLDVFCLHDLLRGVAREWRGANSTLRFLARFPAEPLYTVGDRAKLTDAVHKLLGATYEFAQPSGTVEMNSSHAGDELTVRMRGSRDCESGEDSFEPASDLSVPSDILRLHGGAASLDYVPGRSYDVTVRLPVIR
jgi:signal transduction histidine kinase